MDDEQEQIAHLLRQWDQGDDAAQEQLFRRLLPVMRQIARQQLNNHGRALSLESRDLASESVLKLLQLHCKPETQQHLLRLLAKIMRAACIDLARQRQTRKRSGEKVSLTKVDLNPTQSIDLLDLDLALDRLANRDDVACQITELRFFAGLSESEVAQNLSMSRATVSRKWRFARLYLSQQLSEI